MRRPISRSIPLAIAAILLLAPPAFAAGGFSFGVTAGEVTSSSAQLWGKANKSGAYTLDIARNKRFTRGLDAHPVRARKSHDNTLQLRVKRLRPNTRYWFRFARGRKRSAVGTFVTAPKPKQNATIEFAWSGDQDFNPEPGKTAPFWNDGGVLRRMKAERNNFNVLLGGDRMAIVHRNGSRVAVGTVYQCFHGDSIIANTVVGWHPFDDFVVQFVIPTPLGEAISQVELRLEVTETGTHLAEIVSKAKGTLMARLAADTGMKARQEHIRGLVANFKAHIEGDLPGRRPRVPVQQAISADEIGASARAALAEATI